MDSRNILSEAQVSVHLLQGSVSRTLTDDCIGLHKVLKGVSGKTAKKIAQNELRPSDRDHANKIALEQVMVDIEAFQHKALLHLTNISFDLCKTIVPRLVSVLPSASRICIYESSPMILGSIRQLVSIMGQAQIKTCNTVARLFVDAFGKKPTASQMSAKYASLDEQASVLYTAAKPLDILAETIDAFYIRVWRHHIFCTGALYHFGRFGVGRRCVDGH